MKAGDVLRLGEELIRLTRQNTIYAIFWYYSTCDRCSPNDQSVSNQLEPDLTGRFARVPPYSIVRQCRGTLVLCRSCQ